MRCDDRVLSRMSEPANSYIVPASVARYECYVSRPESTRAWLPALHICQCLYELPTQYKTQTIQPTPSVLSQAPACVESEVIQSYNNKVFLCMEALYSKNTAKGKTKPPIGGFGCLELCLYGIRKLESATP